MEKEKDHSDPQEVTTGLEDVASMDPNEMPGGVSQEQLYKLMGSRRAKLGFVTRKKK